MPSKVGVQESRIFEDIEISMISHNGDARKSIMLDNLISFGTISFHHLQQLFEESED